MPNAGESGNTINVNVTIPDGQCTSINAGASCTFSANIPESSTPGSFTVLAQGNASSSTLRNLWTRAATAVGIKATFDTATNVTIGLVSIPQNNNYNLYILPTNQTININNESSVTVLFSVLVESGPYTSVSLPLPANAIAESMLSPLQQTYESGSVLTFSVTWPAGTTGSESVTAINNNCMSGCSNTANVNFAQAGAGILSIYPSNVNMTPGYTSQTYTLTDTGESAISGINIPSSSGPFTISSNCPANPFSLAPSPQAGSSCTYTIVYTPNGESVGPYTFPISYSNGLGSTESTAFTIDLLPYANIYIESAILVPAESAGNGSESMPFYVESQIMPESLILTYVNNGTGNATAFTVTAGLSLSSGYSIVANTCNAATLESNNTASNCSVTLSVATSSVGEQDLSLTASSLSSTWTDNSDKYINQAIKWNNNGVSQNMIYLAIFPQYTIMAYLSSESNSANSISQIESNSIFYLYYTISDVGPTGVVATLSQIAESVVLFNGVANNTNFYIHLNFYGGISGDTQIVTPILPTGMVSVTSPFNCTLTNPSPESCVLEVNSGTAVAGAKTITFTSTVGTVAPLNFNLVAYWTEISGGANQPPGYGYYGPYGQYNNSISPSSLLLAGADGYLWSYVNESWTQLTSSTVSGGSYSEVSQASTPNAIAASTGGGSAYPIIYVNESWIELTNGSAGDLYGGISVNSVPNSIFADFDAGPSIPIILYHYDGSSWSSPLMGAAPAPLNLCRIVGAPSLESIVLMDSVGAGCTDADQYTWIYSAGVWTQITQQYESATQPGSDFPNGCSSPNCSPLTYWSADNNTPTGDQVVGSTYVNIANYASPSSIIVTTPDNNELWVWNGSNWTMLSESNSLTKPHAVSAVWGVQTASSLVVTDMASNLWTYTNGTWESLTNGIASGSQPESAISVSVNSTPSNLYIVGSDNQLWYYNGRWTKLSGTAPAPLSVSMIVGSPTANSILVVDNSNPQQLWTYNGYAWNQRTGTSNPNQPQDAGSQGYLWTPGNPNPNSIVQFDSGTNIWIGAGFQ